MAKKEYEIISHDTIEQLKSEVDRLRSGQSYVENKDPTHLTKGMNDLSENLERFAKMFEQATQEMKMEEHEQEFLINTLQPMMKKLEDKMDMILSQNEQIAKGIVSVADMMKQDIPALKSAILNMQRDTPEPEFHPSFSIPPSPPPPMLQQPPMPPPPMASSGAKKKKFGLFI